MFGETVKKLVFEQTTKNVRKINSIRVKHVDFLYVSLFFAVFVIFPYVYIYIYITVVYH